MMNDGVVRMRLLILIVFTVFGGVVWLLPSQGLLAEQHEYYFSQFEGGAKECPDGEFKKVVEHLHSSVDEFVEHFKSLALTRGVGWAICYIDRAEQQLVCTWVDEQHLGQLADVDIVLALDMWEHSYMLDYAPSEKKKYIEAFFKNLNWEVVASRV